MVSRMMGISRGSASSPRSMVSVTVVPFSPRMRFTASSKLKSLVLFPSMSVMMSWAFKPALSAGDPSKGATTVSWLCLMAISAPMPSKRPFRDSVNSSDTWGSKNTE